jgi:outer membrane protein OmpA-like peptidoglycan-associated protein
MRKLILLMVTCFAFSIIANAQTQDKKWNIGFHGGAEQYNGDLGNGFYKYKSPTPFYGFGGISFSRYIGSHVDLNLLFTKGEIGYNNDTAHFRTGFSTATFNVRFNILGPNSFVRPYLIVGAGALLFADNPTVTDKSKIDYAAPSFGGGINFKLGSSVMLNLQEMVLYSTNDNKDGVVANGNDAYLLHTVGLTFNFGNKKDEDKDGVADRSDKCPATPAGVAVDKTGCPLDKDKDGVADYIDACPDVAGTEALKGCPDKDGDNIADKDDRCPDVAGLAELKGCPDADKDGVADIDDKCPDTKAGYKADATGCPMDNDKDGVINEEDECPDMAGPVALHGCPDKDGDGVSDKDDHCPNVAGNIANKGCPEIAKEDVKKITQIASRIYFETNSDKIKTVSMIRLDELIDLLKKYDAANLSIEGHTDDKGDDAYNLTLSQKRADAVKKYLIAKGIAESRLTSIGYGETKPIADNKTSMGRTKNRRVELKASY